MREPFAPSRDSDASGAASTDASAMSAFLPVMILALVLLAWFGFQPVQLHAERDGLNEAMTNQDKTLAESRELRDSFYAIAQGAEQLADAGDADARRVVDERKKRGIKITPNPPLGDDAAAPAPPAK